VEELLGRGTCVCILRGWRFSESVSFLLMYVVGGVGVFLCFFTYTVSVACFMRCFGFGFCITFLSFRTIIIPVLFLYSVIISSFHVSTRYSPVPHASQGCTFLKHSLHHSARLEERSRSERVQAETAYSYPYSYPPLFGSQQANSLTQPVYLPFRHFLGAYVGEEDYS
jgi:hypothetical protein